MKKYLFNHVAILGLGLIGGSLALDLKSLRLCRRVTGYNRSAKGRAVAKKRKACDEVFAKPEDAVVGADLIVLATPVRHIPSLAKQIAPYLKAGAVLTDVGSTKAGIVRQVSRLLPRSVTFIGGHPVAGTERSGMEAAEKGLFKDRWWLFTPARKDRTAAQALRRLESLVQALGAQSAGLSPKVHDQFLAAISHLPHMVAYSLVDAVMKFSGGKAIRFSAGGFRDFTRITASSPEMWADISLENRAALLALIKRFEKSLRGLKKLISKGDAKGLRNFFSRAAEVRRKL